MIDQDSNTANIQSSKDTPSLSVALSTLSYKWDTKRKILCKDARHHIDLEKNNLKYFSDAVFISTYPNFSPHSGNGRIIQHHFLKFQRKLKLLSVERALFNLILQIPIRQRSDESLCDLLTKMNIHGECEKLPYELCMHIMSFLSHFTFNPKYMLEDISN